MKLNQREMNLLALTIGVTMIVSGYLAAERAIQERGGISRSLTEMRDEIEGRQSVIEQSTVWRERLRALRETLPVYPPQQDVTTDLLNLLESTAGRHDVVLLRRDVERERRDGELFELTINCRWRGHLEGLVHFLFDLQQQGVRLGVRQLSITPRGRGQLEGTMTIDGAYSRLPAARAETAALQAAP